MRARRLTVFALFFAIVFSICILPIRLINNYPTVMIVKTLLFPLLSSEDKTIIDVIGFSLVGINLIRYNDILVNYVTLLMVNNHNIILGGFEFLVMPIIFIYLVIYCYLMEWLLRKAFTKTGFYDRIKAIYPGVTN